ncbi:MAG: sodium ion-translocating decarboxylase subunit beta [Clostridiales bacterium]|nr:sodium ion-translocating decarboxylase subunit beta [Clostridiales bacterium]
MDVLSLFQGIGTLVSQDPAIAAGRLVLIAAGIFLVYCGVKGLLEPLIMVPMGFGMLAVNAGVLFLSATQTGTIFLDPLVEDTDGIMTVLQIDFLQPVYTMMFSNGLIACLVFMGIGVITDVGNVLRYPFTSMFIALFAELGTIVTFPIARAMGLSLGESAAIAIVGTADGPMVLFASLMLAKDIFVPVTVVAYLYLSLTYAGYPFFIRLLVPKHLRGIVVVTSKKGKTNITAGQKIAFDAVGCTLLCLLFPVAAPLFVSFFTGNAIRESGILKYSKLLEDVFLYFATFFLGFLLGVLCEASTLLNPKVLILLVLGMVSLGLSGIGGIIGGYLVYLINGKNFNPAIGIAGVSCVPTTAKIAQHEVVLVNKRAIILNLAMGACICGVITSAILTGVYVALIPLI